MKPALANLFTFIKLTPGRRLHVLRELRLRAQARALSDLVAHIDQAIAHNVHTHELNQRWKAQGRVRGSGSAKVAAVDRLTSQTFSALRDQICAYMKGALPDDPKVAPAKRALDQLFPNGVAALTRLPYVEKLSALDVMLDTLRQELALEVTALALDHMVARLSTLFELYEAALEQAAGRLLFRDVKAARDRGHGFMLEIVAHIVGRFYRQDDANHEQARTELLEPLWQQDQAMREYLRARRLRGAADGAELDGDIDIDIEADSADATAELAVPAAIPPALAPAPPTAPALAPPTAPAPAPAATVDVDDRARAMTASDRLTD